MLQATPAVNCSERSENLEEFEEFEKEENKEFEGKEEKVEEVEDNSKSDKTLTKTLQVLFTVLHSLTLLALHRYYCVN